MAEQLPDKQYYRIGEVATLLAVNTSVLRFWETEFPQLQPNKSRSGQRLYTKSDLALAMEIRRLLYQEKMTIPGARRQLSQHRRTNPETSMAPVTPDRDQFLEDIKRQLIVLRDSL